ncbi:hypothetical protein ACSNN7_11635 [Micromonospora sp. URMC 105]|uniref:hypothetical protein n=1 Tax=Micromonospora sp. URMC 105 TaxID=3423413 RepID=UPI003F1D45D7
MNGVLAFLAFLGVPVYASLAFAFLRQVGIALAFCTSLRDWYRIWAVPKGDFRSLISLPLLSAGAGVGGGIGVNVVTDAEMAPWWEAGVLAVALGVLAPPFFGVLAAIEQRPVSPARRLAWRLSTVSAQLDAPFPPVGHLSRLRAEVDRYGRVADRLIDHRLLLGPRHLGRDASKFASEFKEVLREAGGTVGRAAVALMTASPLAWPLIALVDYSQGRRPHPALLLAPALLVVIAVGIAVLARINDHTRRRRFGSYLRAQCGQILLQVDRLSRRYPENRDVRVTRSLGKARSAAAPPTLIRPARLRNRPVRSSQRP